jgi:lipid-binding SYLF domain-containing protein
MNNDGIEGLLTTHLTLGGDMAISAGPIGRNAEIATDLSLRAGILSYSQSRGFYGGVALNGALIIPDGKANKAYYGTAISSRDILLDSRAPILPSSQRLIDALNRYSSGG